MLQIADLTTHYAAMIEIDRSVHDDLELARQEVNLALLLAGSARVQSVFLPCCGTGRHIQPLLDRGVERIAAMDLSQECLTLAQERFAGDSRVTLSVGDLRDWRGLATHDAALLLGNSWGDFTDGDGLRALSAGILLALRAGGTFVMDYIGEALFDYADQTSEWLAEFHGEPAIDRRTVRFDSARRIATIEIEILATAPPRERLWNGVYRKIVQNRQEIFQAFDSIRLEPVGRAEDIIPYHRSRGDLGMLARATWWVGRKEETMGR